MNNMNIMNDINNMIVCIDVYGEDYDLSFLKLYQTYTTVYQVHKPVSNKTYYKLNNVYGFHNSKRFVSLKEYRKIKLQKLESV